MPNAPTSPSARKTAPVRPARQRSLVIGVSGYRAPIHKLPAVAADARAMARLLSSKHGVFQRTGVNVITERQATRDAVLAALKQAFVGARTTDTIFVYLAGHGGVEGDGYYYVPYDAKLGRLSETGVSLAEIKAIFDRTASRRVFLWLDFCHSGGILARGGKTDDASVIRRAIGVVSGHGKIIVAACTPAQFAYEDPALGHGLFTHALLRGLKGEATSAQGEVTALSLYEFIDHQVKHPSQQPTFYGEMTGRIVLMHHPAGAAVAPAKGAAKAPAKPKAAAKSPAAGRVNASGNLLLLDGRVYSGRSVKERPDGSVEIEIVPKNAEEEASLRGLRGDRFSQQRTVSFAFRNQSFTAQVGEISSITAGARPAWSVILSPVEARNNVMSGVGYSNFSSEQLGELRARLLLLDEKPGAGEHGRDTLLVSFVQGPLKELGVSEAVFRSVAKRFRVRSGDFLRQARLWAVYYLHAGEICDDVLELRLGPVRAGKLSVKFRGRRKSRYSNGEPQDISFEGTCPLA